MNITCSHCGGRFSITVEQLGTRGKCPHCRATIVLPRSRSMVTDHGAALEPPSFWTESLLCGIGAIGLHLILLILLAMVPWRHFQESSLGEGEPVLIGRLPPRSLMDMPEERFQPIDVPSTTNDTPMEMVDARQLSPLGADLSKLPSPSLATLSSAAASASPFEVDTLQESTALSGAGESFDRMIERLSRDGLDIVITFDSTGSMQGEIDEVKSRIERIGNILFRLISKTRLSICTYRDNGDDYVVKGLPLTDNLTRVVLYLDSIQADGGGDTPEAVDQGLEWAIQQNKFRRRARKVILLFGDAPPHPNRLVRCQSLASQFRKMGGIVSTVTCRQPERLDAFISIAQLGRGESYLTRHERQIVSQLMILVFGSQHRDKVIEAFDLMREMPDTD